MTKLISSSPDNAPEPIIIRRSPGAPVQRMLLPEGAGTVSVHIGKTKTVRLRDHCCLSFWYTHSTASMNSR